MDHTMHAIETVHAVQQINKLTERQRQVLGLVLGGHQNKNIAVLLGVSQRTVENHRQMIYQRTGTRSLAELVRLGLLAGIDA